MVSNINVETILNGVKVKLIKLIFLIFISLLGVSFSVLNATKIKINLYIGSYDVYLSLLLVITLGLGILIGFLAMLGTAFRLKAENYKIKHKAKLAEKEISNLRTLPIKDI